MSGPLGGIFLTHTVDNWPTLCLSLADLIANKFKSVKCELT